RPADRKRRSCRKQRQKEPSRGAEPKPKCQEGNEGPVPEGEANGQERSRRDGKQPRGCGGQGPAGRATPSPPAHRGPVADWNKSEKSRVGRSIAIRWT